MTRNRLPPTPIKPARSTEENHSGAKLFLFVWPSAERKPRLNSWYAASNRVPGASPGNRVWLNTYSDSFGPVRAPPLTLNLDWPASVGIKQRRSPDFKAAHHRFLWANSGRLDRIDGGRTTIGMKPKLLAGSRAASVWLGWLGLGMCLARAATVDLTQAVVVAPAGLTPTEERAVTMLVEEVEKRTQVRWDRKSAWPEPSVPVVVVGPWSALDQVAGRFAGELRQSQGAKGAEGYHLCVKASRGAPAVLVVGNDPRGVMFGVGRLLRTLRLTKGKVVVAEELNLTAAPQSRLRGHQLGYRPKTNSYDAWDVPAWEQYLRDLIVFGCNAIELIPPRSDDAPDSPHFPRPPGEMMIEMSRLADLYGVDVWIWYPALDRDYADARTVEFALQEWGEVFKKLPRIDAVFVPGGDPGHTPPKHLMALLEQQTRQLHRFHPNAQMWVSPQSFNQIWLDEFLGLLRADRPAWLSGVVFGPQVRVGLPQLRQWVPAQYPIRHYPDITHSRQCQYPVPDWDVAYAVTEARECINPRPTDEAVIFRATNPYTVGFITYSEGCNDDVNKAVWSALGWEADAAVVDILRDYSRYFIGEVFADDFAQGLLALERNWRGPLLANAGVEATLAQFRAMERAATPRDLKNWRFQQGLFRAYYDAYTRRRLIHETELEGQAMERLRQTPTRGPLVAMAEAERILDRALTERVAADWRERILELGEALYQSIGMQLSVAKYQAIAVDRGASLDTLDYPLNNRPWLREQFARIRRLSSEAERLKAIAQIVEWENPGPGGFYDDLGNVARQPHLVRGPGLEKDPGSLQSPRAGFEEDLVVDEPDEKAEGARRVSWLDHAETLYDTPLRVRYTDLDPKARYRVRVVYAGDNPKRKIRLVANDGIEVHPFLVRPFPFKPVEFDLPPQATASGQLTLTWSGEPGLGGNGRGCQVSEIWLLKRE
jgi:hypothetical protein